MTVALVIGTAISFLMKDLFAAIPFNAYYEILYALCLFSLLFLCTYVICSLVFRNGEAK